MKSERRISETNVFFLVFFHETNSRRFERENRRTSFDFVPFRLVFVPAFAGRRTRQRELLGLGSDRLEESRSTQRVRRSELIECPTFQLSFVLFLHNFRFFIVHLMTTRSTRFRRYRTARWMWSLTNFFIFIVGILFVVGIFRTRGKISVVVVFALGRFIALLKFDFDFFDAKQSRERKIELTTKIGRKRDEKKEISLPDSSSCCFVSNNE